VAEQRKHPGFTRRRDDLFSLTIRLSHRPTCPFCLAPLADRAVTFHRHLALCSRCFGQGSRVSRRFWNRTIRLHLTQHFTGEAGLIFWTPQADWPSRVALHQALGLVELTPVVTRTHREQHTP
jgi:hypothetical protein